MPSWSLRFEEQQVLDLAAKARVHCSRKGYLLKSDAKLKRLTQRWCCVYYNFFFYFESESVPKPLGVILLEGCNCNTVEQGGQVVNEGAFYIDATGGKTYYFLAHNQREKNEWIDNLSTSSMGWLQHEVEELRARCAEYSHIISTKTSEVRHLKEENKQAQQNIDHLHDTLQGTLPRHRQSVASPVPPDPHSPDSLDNKASVLQGYVHGWLIRRKWRKIVKQYINSPMADLGKKRNQLIWKFAASEEDYVSQLTVLNEEYKQHLEMAAISRKPLLSLEQFNTLFRNSAELLLLHQLFLRGLHSCLDRWPVIVFGNILKLFVPIMSIYHKFLCDHLYASEVLLSLLSDAVFKEFLSGLESRLGCNGMSLDSLLNAPLKRLPSYVQELQELCAHTSPEHVDYGPINDIIRQLESIIKMVSDEGSQGEILRQVLNVEGMIEGGCTELLDKDQALIKQGILQQCEEKANLSGMALPFTGGKLRSQQRYCFLFSKHLLLTTRTIRKPNNVYKLVKILRLTQCHVNEYRQTDSMELMYCGIKMDYESEVEKEVETFDLLATNVNNKAEWIADITQCVENEKQNKILRSQRVGMPVEFSSRFIRYSTFRTGKEQLVNSARLECLLERLVKISCFGHNFLNTFLLSFPLYTNADTVFNFLEKSLWESLKSREKRRGSISPQDAIRDARVIQSQSLLRSPIMSAKRRHYSSHLGVPGKSRWTSNSLSFPHHRKHSDSLPIPIHIPMGSKNSTDEEDAFAGIKISFEPTSARVNCTSCKTGSESTPTASGVLFALKQWICKHFYHFKDDSSLSKKLEVLLDQVKKEPLLTSSERTALQEVYNIYHMQKDANDELSPIMQLRLLKIPPHLPNKPFECLLLWNSRATAEQLCLIESALFQRVSNGEILRYFSAKGSSKSQVAPNLALIFEHFNRISLFFMWSVTNQRYFVDRTNILQFLIEVAWECYQLHNFSSVMQLTSALEHGSTSRFKNAWDGVSKPLKQQFRQLVQLSSTEGRFKELRVAMKTATPPSIPYLGILLSEISGVVEGMPTYLLDDDKLINFSKMRRCVRLITMAMGNQKEPYELNFIPEISKVLLHTSLPGNEDDLYMKVDEMEKNGELNPVPPT